MNNSMFFANFLYPHHLHLYPVISLPGIHTFTVYNNWAYDFLEKFSRDSWFIRTLHVSPENSECLKAVAPHSSTVAWKIPWMEEPSGLQSMGLLRVRQDSDFTFTFHFHALEKEMAAHSSVLAWRIPWTEKPGGLQSMGSHRVGHDWSDLATAAAVFSVST